MENYKKEFIDFMIECEVLKFGDFVTKSGRKTPFFVNTGFYRSGAQASSTRSIALSGRNLSLIYLSESTAALTRAPSVILTP